MQNKKKSHFGIFAQSTIPCAIIFILALNLYYALRYGLIYGGPRGHSHFLTFQQSPFYFSLSAIVSVAMIAILAPIVYFKVTSDLALEKTLSMREKLPFTAREKRDYSDK